MKILLFAGAGTSVELGVPAMVGMGEEFTSHAAQWGIEPALVQKLMGESPDIEHLIEALDAITSARASLEAMGEVGASLERADTVRAEVEWFVQHVAERVSATDAALMWGPVLRTASVVDITVVTTNYDRAIELAANAVRVDIDDGFTPFAQGEIAPWVGFQGGKSCVRLAKLHGSTDWYSEREHARPTKLRHPMPLFGRSSLRLTSGVELGSALVLPSREKLLTHDPYPRLSQVFLNAADACDLAVFVGSSLRDHHIRNAVEAIAQRVPVFLVNRSGNSHGLEGVKSVRQSASAFLISILPNALTETDPAAVLASAALTSADGRGVLIAVRQALDKDAPSDIRRRAIEQLDEMGLTLDPLSLRELLADEDPAVARYALGLISISPRRLDLVEYAATSSHASEPAFSEDLLLLRDMLA